MPEIVSTPNALVQTTNGKQFYFYSGVIDVTTSEITMMSIDNIGERDSEVTLTLGWKGDTNQNAILRVKINGQVVHQNESENSSTSYVSFTPPPTFIIPANTSLTVTLQMDGSNFDFTLSAYGLYLSM